MEKEKDKRDYEDELVKRLPKALRTFRQLRIECSKKKEGEA